MRGITCSSFNSISLEPPIISFAIKIPSKTRDVLLNCSGYAVHLLSFDQIQHSVWFSSPRTQNDFKPFAYYLNQSKVPILQGCMSVLECQTHEKHLIGDHEIWYSQVTEILQDGIKKSDNKYQSLKPLLYYESSYRSIGDEVFIQAFETMKLDFGEWTHRAHVRMAWIYFMGDAGDAHQKIRHGIKQYNQANAQFITHGYNETITSFFCHLVQLAVQKDRQAGLEDIDFIEFLIRYPYLDQFSTIFKYYSKDLLYSKDAKEQFVLPDLQPLPTNLEFIQ